MNSKEDLKKNIYVVYTAAHLYMMSKVINYNEDNCILIVGKGISEEVIEIFIKRSYKTVRIEDISKISGNLIYKINQYFKVLKKYRKISSEFGRKYDLYTFLDNNLLNQILINWSNKNNCGKIILLEDGIGLYRKLRKNSVVKKCGILSSIKLALLKLIDVNYSNIYQGENYKVDIIYCSRPDLLQNSKCRSINEIVKERKFKLNVDKESFQYLIITQPLSEDNEISVNMEKDFYIDLINRIEPNMTIGVKLHPRESRYKYEYLKQFNNVKILDKSDIPFEMLAEYIEMKNILTISSSSVLNFVRDDVNIVFLYRCIGLKNEKEYSVIELFNGENVTILDKLEGF